MEPFATSTATSLVVGYDVPDLSHLRYYGPLVHAFLCNMSDVKHRFFHTRKNSKYNGLSDQTNWARYQEIMSWNPMIEVIERRSDDAKCDVLVSVESTDKQIKRRKHVAISHGIDCIQLAKKLADCNMYVCGPTLAAHSPAKDLPVYLHPTPMTMLELDNLVKWGRERYRRSRPIATVFYPDQGHGELANHLIATLESDGYTVYVKQRRKWQGIGTQQGIHVYDELWAPSEAIVLPLISDVVVGFGSTAYLDLVEVGIPYVNVDVAPACHPKSEFYRTCPADLPTVMQEIAHSVKPDVRQRCSQQDIVEFLKEVIS